MLTNLLPELIKLAQQAGQATLTYWRNEVITELKADNSPVTKADLIANQIILSGLASLTPNIPIISEEAHLTDFATRKTWKQWWLIDPLDGTKEFIAGNTDFTINIALINQGYVAFGVVFVPATHSCYVGGKDIGAWHIDQSGNKQFIHCRKADYQSLLVVASRNHSSLKQQLFLDYLQKIAPTSLKNAGSSLKFCLIAEGYADCYPRFAPTSQWDTAAAQAILEGAGGSVLSETGQILDYFPRENFLNPNFVALGDTKYWLNPIFDIIKKLTNS